MTYQELLVKVREAFGEDAENTIKTEVLRSNLAGYSEGLEDGHADEAGAVASIVRAVGTWPRS